MSLSIYLTYSYSKTIHFILSHFVYPQDGFKKGENVQVVYDIDMKVTNYHFLSCDQRGLVGTTRGDSGNFASYKG